MKKTTLHETVAAIDIGSNYLKLSIAEVTASGNINILEEVVKNTNIGRDTFSSGRVTPETISSTCNDLKKFLQLMKDYKVKHYKAVATSGIRESENRRYILEQIRLMTGIKVTCINTAEEGFFLLKALRYSSSSAQLVKSKPTLVVNITTDAVESSVFDKDELILTDHIQIGSLRLKEIFHNIHETSVASPHLIQQYIDSQGCWLKSSFNDREIKHLIAFGGELRTIIELIEHYEGSTIKNNFIEREDFLKLHKELYNMSIEQIQFKYNLSKKKAELLIPTILILNFFLVNTEASGIYTPDISLNKGILNDIADSLYDLPRKNESMNAIISSAYNIAKKYKVDKKHTAYVEKIALSIFDQTSRIHKLSGMERLYLQIASILHDIGGFISITNHSHQTYNIIKTLDLIGFSHREINIIANIALYHTTEDIPLETHENFVILSHTDKLLVSILASILKLAEALDTSHLQKIQDLKLSISGNLLFFNLTANGDITLEEWNFNTNSIFFQEVMGIKPVI